MKGCKVRKYSIKGDIYSVISDIVKNRNGNVYAYKVEYFGDDLSEIELESVLDMHSFVDISKYNVSVKRVE